MSSLLGINGALVLNFTAFIYNMVIVIRLLHRTLSERNNEKDLKSKNDLFLRKKFIWALSSAVAISIGSLLSFFWFVSLYRPTVGVSGIIGFFFIAANNVTAAIFYFKTENTKVLRKIGGISFSLLAIYPLLAMFNKVAAYTSFTLPRFLNWIISLPAVSYGLVEALLFIGGSAYRFPIVFLIPLAIPVELEENKIEKEKQKEKVEEEHKNKKKSKKKSAVFLEDPEEEQPKKGRNSIVSFIDNGVKGIFVLLLLFIIIFSFIGAGVLISFSNYTAPSYNPSFAHRSDFNFGVVLSTGSFQANMSVNYMENLNTEISLIKELGVNTVKVDVINDILINNLSAFTQEILQLKLNNFKIMLSAYGNVTWAFPYEDFHNYSVTLRNEALNLTNLYHPDFIIIYPQPIVFQTYYLDPNDNTTIEQWAAEINKTASAIHNLSNDTKVIASLTLDDVDAGLFDLIWNNTVVDEVILNIYVYQAKDLNFGSYLAVSDQPAKRLWISDVGLSPVMYSERIQSAAITKELELITSINAVVGYIYEPLLDRTIIAQLNGLVAENGYKRMAFYRYKSIISEVLA